MVDTVLKLYFRTLTMIKMIPMSNFRILDRMNKVTMILNSMMIKTNKMKILFQSQERLKANKTTKVSKGQKMRMKFNQKVNKKNRKFKLSKNKRHLLLV